MFTTQQMLSRCKCQIAPQKLGRSVGCWDEAKGHYHSLVLCNIKHEVEESLVGLADMQVHVEVRKVVPPLEVFAVTKDRLKGMCALHLEVLIHELAVERRRSTFVVFVLEKC